MDKITITIRNEDEIKKFETLFRNSGLRTKTSLINLFVNRHPFLESGLKEAEKKIDALENELYQIKSIIREKSRADKKYQELYDQLAVE